MSNPVVVFTGPAKLESGKTILRESLARATLQAGLRMHPTYTPACSYLVASRADTVKARKAKLDGKMVLTYDEYVRHLSNLGVDALDPKWSDGVEPHKIVDTAPEPYKVMDETGAFVL